ncbi:MAG TPA: hypothetical protein VFI97_02040 [Arthrobacter sp.]|nr:hypothetical protein [Arthrobacter sp.]
MQEVKPVPGVAASVLMARGFILELLGFLCIVPIVFESYLPGPWLVWGGTFLGLVLVLVIAGVAVTLRSLARSKSERSAGYTTLWKVANENLELAYIDGKDGRLIAASGESRPRTGRRADLEAAKARH